MLAEATSGASSIILLLFLSIAVATDVVQHRISNLLIVMMLSCGLVLAAGLLQMAGFVAALQGALVGFLILIPFYAIGGMGAGDVKLLAAIGTFLGPWGVLVAGILALGLGGILGLGVILWRNVARGPLPESLSVPPAQPGAESSLTLPYAVAIAAGTVAAIFGFDAFVVSWSAVAVL